MAESTLNSNPHGRAVTFSCQDFHPLQGLGSTTQDLQEPQIQQQSKLNSWDPLLLSSCPGELTVKWKWVMSQFYPPLKHSVWIAVWNILTNPGFLCEISQQIPHMGSHSGDEQDTYGLLCIWEKSARDQSHLSLFTAPKNASYTQKQSGFVYIRKFFQRFCVRAWADTSSHCSCCPTSQATEMVALAVTCPPLTEWMERGSCSWNIKVIKKQKLLKLLKSKHTMP